MGNQRKPNKGGNKGFGQQNVPKPQDDSQRILQSAKADLEDVEEIIEGVPVAPVAPEPIITPLPVLADKPKPNSGSHSPTNVVDEIGIQSALLEFEDSINTGTQLVSSCDKEQLTALMADVKLSQQHVQVVNGKLSKLRSLIAANLTKARQQQPTRKIKGAVEGQIWTINGKDFIFFNGKLVEAELKGTADPGSV